MLTCEEMLTILAKIQTVINDCPLTFLYEDPGEQVLTPNHLLFGRRMNLITVWSENKNLEIVVQKGYKYLSNIVTQAQVHHYRILSLNFTLL